MSKDILEELKPIFYPRSVAIVGASKRMGNFGGMFTISLLRTGFKEIYPVHPREQEIHGLKVYPSIKEIPAEVDLAIVTTPPEAVAGVIRECTEKGVQGVVIYTAGFGERGEEGKKFEQEIVEIARKGGTRLIGPNCMGIYCPASKLTNMPMAINLPGITQGGSVGMISHSGSLSGLTPMMAMTKGIRFSKVISCGNECDLNAVELLEYLGEDPETEIITAYLEGVKDGGRFYELARSISRRKPIIVWKGGITEWGAKAAASHTGALAGSKEIWRALFAQAGIIPVNSAEELIDCLLAFYYLPLPKGRRIAIVSGPGGPAVATSDACVEFGLELALLSDQTQQRIGEVIAPVGTSTNNPVDLGLASVFAPHWYEVSVEALMDDEGVDMVIVIGGGDRRISKMMTRTAKEREKPLVMVMSVPPEMMAGEYKFLLDRGIPAYSDGRRAAMALGRLAGYAGFLKSAE
jgi:acyl-CoA synthetase (NDP forming)